MIEFIKASASTLNVILLLVLLAIIFKVLKQQTACLWCTWLVAILFLVTTTGFLPISLAQSLESKFSPLKMSSANDVCRDSTFIVVLASGYSYNAEYPALTQLETSSVARLAEGVRLKQKCRRARLVCSGFSASFPESQAVITKKAAMELGVEEQSIMILEKPTTTLEEAEEFKKIYTQNSDVILVTDAMHMPRAVEIFRAKGIRVIAAPTNFKVKRISASKLLTPSVKNVILMDYVLHEYLAEVKSLIFNQL